MPILISNSKIYLKMTSNKWDTICNKIKICKNSWNLEPTTSLCKIKMDTSQSKYQNKRTIQVLKRETARNNNFSIKIAVASRDHMVNLWKVAAKSHL